MSLVSQPIPARDGCDIQLPNLAGDSLEGGFQQTVLESSQDALVFLHSTAKFSVLSFGYKGAFFSTISHQCWHPFLKILQKLSCLDYCLLEPY